MPPPIVLLDVMDTLVHDPFIQMPAFFSMTWNELRSAKHPTAWIDFERDLIDEQAFLEGFFADGRSFDHGAFLAMFRDGYRWLDGMEELVVDLKAAGQEMHVLSNYPRWYERIEDGLELSRYLPWSFVSCHTGVRKPDPEAFLGAARSLNCSPSDCLLIDNSQVNCEGARNVGMDAVLFQGIAALRSALREAGVLPYFSARTTDQ